MTVQENTRAALTVVNERLNAIETRLTYLEANQSALVIEAKSAASGAASAVASGVASNMVSDVITRLTRIEVRLEPRQGVPSIAG